jgi:hypothetical protein
MHRKEENLTENQTTSYGFRNQFKNKLSINEENSSLFMHFVESQKLR